MPSKNFYPRNAERRVGRVSLELRTSQKPARSGSAGTISGHAVVWNSLSNDLGAFRESIARGAFTDSLRKNPDVKFLVNHDPNRIVGRTTNRTLRINEDSTGLHFECDVADTTVGRDLVASVRRQDLSQCSFAFICGDQDWSRCADPDTGEQVPLRTVRSATILDCSVVTSPAYSATTVGVRESLDDLDDGDCDEDDPDCDGDNVFFNSARSRSLWPTGVPAEIRSHVPNFRPQSRRSTIVEARRRRLTNILLA